MKPKVHESPCELRDIGQNSRALCNIMKCNFYKDAVIVINYNDFYL